MIWKFGIGLALCRTLSAEKSREELDGIFRRADKEINDCVNASNESASFQSRALVIYGQLIDKYDFSCRILCNSSNNPESLKPSGGRTSLDCYYQAVKLAPGDCFVLELAGQQLRKCRKNQENREKARECLEKALELHPTSRCCHNLALMYEDDWKKRHIKTEKVSKHPTIQNTLHSASAAARSKHSNISQVRVFRSGYISKRDPDNPLLLKAKSLLQKSVELSKGINAAALFDLSRVCVRLNQLEEALESLFQISKCDYYDSVLIASSYEHRGMYLYEMSGMERFSSEEREAKFQNSKLMFLKAIGIQSQLVHSRCPEISFNTLFDILINQSQKNEYDSEPRKQLGQLCEIANKPGMAIDFFSDARRIQPDDIQSIEGLVRQYRKTSRFTEAVLCLQLLKYNPGYHHPDFGKQFSETCKKAAEQSLYQGLFDFSADYYRLAYNQVFQISGQHDLYSDPTFFYDAIVIYAYKEQEAFVQSMVSALQHRCSLTCFLDCIDARVDDSCAEDFRRHVDRSRNQILIIGEKERDAQFSKLADIVVAATRERSEDVKSKIIVLKSNRRDNPLPDTLRLFPCVEFVLNNLQTTDHNVPNSRVNTVLEGIMGELTTI